MQVVEAVLEMLGEQQERAARAAEAQVQAMALVLQGPQILEEEVAVLLRQVVLFLAVQVVQV
jgi:hypothetical protein